MVTEQHRVLVAAYPQLSAARSDFDALVAQVADKKLQIDGAILVAKDDQGQPVVADTGSHLGRRGAGWGAGVGVAVGLFAPALLASVAVGAAALVKHALLRPLDLRFRIQ